MADQTERTWPTSPFSDPRVGDIVSIRFENGPVTKYRIIRKTPESDLELELIERVAVDAPSETP